jgi:hypothetical protein
MTLLRPSRRNLLVFMAIVPAATAIGGYWWTLGPDAFISKILIRRLPGLRVDKASIALLSRDVQADRIGAWQETTGLVSFGRKLGFKGKAFAATIVGIDAVAHFWLTAAQFERLERVVITLFILGSDYLNDPRPDVVTYSGTPDVCPNPFAQYD